jgi:hypothetical protein
VHNTTNVLFRLCANADPQRDSGFTNGPSDVLDHASRRNRQRQQTRHRRDESRATVATTALRLTICLNGTQGRRRRVNPGPEADAPLGHRHHASLFFQTLDAL